ncbi:extracellular solute-binding protein [Paenibacillus sp. GCM10023252]|uniref:extracellular solute-binding protein n=1 Tax=Paenibacillus sp. GCM10023252 TaxID=3252649 RepID=UPI003621F946
MKAAQKWVSLLVVLSFMIALVACSSGNNGGNKEEAGTGESPAPTADAAKPAKISIMTNDFSQPVPGGKSMDDPTLKYLAEKTNTDLNVIFLPQGQADNQRRIKFAAGEIPDVVQGYGVDGELYINKQLIPLDELIDQYGPNLKKVIPQAAWDGVKRDGKIYAIPEAPKGDSLVNRVLYVRKDLMEKAGYTTPPKTTDEFLDLLRKLKALDPNLIPYSARENFTWLDSIVGMFGTSVFGGELEDGKVVPSNTSKKMKDALTFIKQLYDEKLIDSEFMTNKRNTWEQKIQSGQVAVWTHAPDLIVDWQDRLNKSLPGAGAQVAVIPTPKAPGVEQAGFSRLPYNKAFSITTAAKNPEAIIKFFDWLVTEEGQEFVNFGVPGITHTKDNGSIFYNKQLDVDNKTSIWRVQAFNLAGWNEEHMKIQVGQDAVNLLKATYEVGKQDGYNSITLGMPAIKSSLPEVGEFGTATTMFVETASKIVLGDQKIEYFDTYVSNWKKQGGDELIKQATDWYNTKK